MTNEHQAIQGTWLRETFDGKPSLYRQLNNFKGEADEVIAEVQGDTIATIENLPQERKLPLAEEVVDTIIAGMGILTCLGFDFESLFYKKMGIMYDKYNPQQVQELVGNGHSQDSAMAIRKEEWRGRKLYE